MARTKKSKKRSREEPQNDHDELGDTIETIEPSVISNNEDEKNRNDLGLTVTAETTLSNNESENVTVNLLDITSNKKEKSKFYVPAPLSKDFLQSQPKTSSTTKQSYYDFLTKAFTRRFRKGKIQTQIRPTPIQLQIWPLFMHSEIFFHYHKKSKTKKSHRGHINSLIAIAPTGSGKTLAYGVPLLYSSSQDIDTSNKTNMDVLNLKSNVNSYIRGLVLVPTRELATQVTKELNRCISSSSEIHPPVMAIYGGKTTTKKQQLEILLNPDNAHIHVLVATPGRLLDLLQNDTNNTANDAGNSEHENSKRPIKEKDSKEILELNNINFIVLDEADRMLCQMGMSNQVQDIFQCICPTKNHNTSGTQQKRTTWLFSATYPDALQNACTMQLHMTERLIVRVNTLSFQIAGNRYSKKDKAEEENKDQCNKDDGVEDVTSMIGDDKYTPPESIEEASVDQSKKKTFSSTMELASIPSHVTQILHVCAAHKKAKKLMTTMNKHIKVESNDVGIRKRKLTIIFFATIKALKYIVKLLRGEGKFENWQCLYFLFMPLYY